MGEMLLSQLSLYNARPTLRVEGRQDARIDSLLQSLVLSEQEGGLSSLRAGFLNWESREGGEAGLALEDERLLSLGTRLNVYGGEVASPTEIFRGKISALEFAVDADGPPRLTAHAEDGLATLRLTRRTEVYEQQSASDVVQAVARRAGLTPFVDIGNDISDTWFQCNESDLAFLRRLLRRLGADVQMVADELHVVPLHSVHRSDVELRLHSQLHRVRAVVDIAHQTSEVRITGFDARAGQAFEGTGSTAPLGPGTGRTGREMLQSRFMDRNEQQSHLLAQTQSEANALAQAAFGARARGFVRIEGSCEGNPSLRVGTHVALKDVSPRFDNTYVVTACEHRWDVARGFETSFQAQCAYFGQPT